jgi:charged multivesicular body protein 5
MRRLFGRSKAAAPPPTLEQTAERLGNRGAHIEQELNEINAKLQRITQEMQKNRAQAPRLKQQARLLLQRRNTLQTQLNQIEGQRFNLDNLAYQQEQVQTNIDAVTCMKATTGVLKTQLQRISIDEVDDVMCDMEDLVADANEISNILATGNGMEDIDDAELEAELDALQTDYVGTEPALAAPQQAHARAAASQPASLDLPPDFFQ